MISIRLVGKDRKIVGIVDDNTPVPHTLARITDESKNYGLADEARLLYPELVKKKEDVFSMEAMAEEVERVRNVAKGAAGGARKEKETDEEVIVNIGDYVESSASDEDLEETTSETAAVLKNQEAAIASALACKKAMKSAAGIAGCKKAMKGAAGIAGCAKTNGYILFIQHIAKKAGVNGGINEFMERFDKDWKMLPDIEKMKWKTRAKAGRSGGGGVSVGRSHSSPGIVRGLLGERVSAAFFPSVGPNDPFASVADEPVPRGRGRGRGRSIRHSSESSY